MSMQWLRGSVLSGVAGGLLAVAAATPAAAGTLYRWKAADGSIAYADDLKRVPERYRAKAEALTSDGLGSYQRYTPTDTAASRDQAEKLAARLDSLRASNAEAVVVAPPAETAQRTPFTEPSAARGLALQSMQDRVGRRRVLGSDGKYHWVLTQRAQIMDQPAPVLGFNGDPESNAPVVVEQKRVMDSRGVATQHVTIVRQGDKVLNVIEPRELESSSNWPKLSDYER